METQSINHPRFPLWHYAGLYVALLAMMTYIFNWAWVSEDAYITFRVIDNFFHGYGLRWNVGERVQVYTHPLWLLLQLPLHAIWPNLFRASIFLSIVCTMAAMVLTLFTVQRPLPVTLVCLFLPLVLSKSFLDYTTSGLENPLCYLLYAAFGYVVFTLRDHPHFWFYLSLTTALMLFARLDNIILCTPVLLWLAYTERRDIRWRQVMVGASPLLAWFGFSLFYYGFLFPNTKYAKLNTGLGILHYLREGWHYTAFTMITDTVGAVAIASPLACILFPLPLREGVRGRGHLNKEFSSLDTPPPRPSPSRGEGEKICLALGIYLYVWYVIAIGGDYMMGRFWALPVFASVWLGYVYLPDKVRPDVVFALAGLLLVAYVAPAMLWDIRKNCQSCTATQEMLLNARNRFWPNQLVTRFYPLHMRAQGEYVLANDGRKLAEEEPPPVKVEYFIGMTGYYAGPQVTLIDELALADPLLARLPAVKRQSFFIGHFRRDIPDGYVDAVRTGNTDGMDPALAKYYDRLRLITSGDLMDMERLKTIIAFNLGLYDDWKQDYLRRN